MTQRILVIEDTEDNRRIMRILLTKAGFDYAEAVDGTAGLDLARSLHPDLVLLDVQLPGMDGYEVARRLKADPLLSRIPVIAVTSYALSGDEAKARAAGCDGYIAKPFSPSHLLAKVTEMLGGDGRA